MRDRAKLFPLTLTTYIIMLLKPCSTIIISLTFYRIPLQVIFDNYNLFYHSPIHLMCPSNRVLSNNGAVTRVNLQSLVE